MISSSTEGLMKGHSPYSERVKNMVYEWKENDEEGVARLAVRIAIRVRGDASAQHPFLVGVRVPLSETDVSESSGT